MTKKELPEKIFIPSIRLPDKGRVDIQIRDENGDMAIIAFRSIEKAKIWLDNGGMKAWIEKDSAMSAKLNSGGVVIIKDLSTKEYFDLCLMIGEPPKRYLHYEPDEGMLFSPQDRQIHIK